MTAVFFHLVDVAKLGSFSDLFRNLTSTDTAFDWIEPTMAGLQDGLELAARYLIVGYCALTRSLSFFKALVLLDAHMYVV